MISNNVHTAERVGKNGKALLKLTNKSTNYSVTIEMKSTKELEALLDIIFNRD